MFNTILLQTNELVDTLNSSSDILLSDPNSKMNLFRLLMAGGWIMIPLGILLFMAIFIFIERYLTIKKLNKKFPNFMRSIRQYISSGDINGAKTYVTGFNTSYSRVISKGIQRIGKPLDAIEKSMENVGRVEIYNMERSIYSIGVIAGIAPMFGFLGTIVGMIQLFYNISATGEYTLATIAGGIYTKMITSASGLIIGLLAYVGYNYLNAKIDKATNQIEYVAGEFIDILQEPAN